MDFEDWRMSSADEYGVRGVDREAYREAVSKLHVLSFHIDRKGENIVSEIDGVIAFIDKRYYGESVSPGDVWLCNAVFRNTVFYVTPLKKITSSIIMGLSDDIREDIVNAIWKTNRREFEKIFEERYKEEIYARATEEDRRYLDLGRNDIIIRVSSYVYLENGALFQHTESRHRWDRFRFVDFAKRSPK